MFNNAVFQVASNHNTIEGIAVDKTPEQDPFYTTKYIFDNTQGPAASISAGFGAICRVYCANVSNSDKISPQISTREINLLDEFDDCFKVRNGYVEETFRNKKPSWDQLPLLKVGIHPNQKVYFGHIMQDGKINLRDTSLHEQHIHQVLCGAYNIGQGTAGTENNKIDENDDYIRTKIISCGNYIGTFLTTSFLNSKKLVLTLLGGGVFKNPLDIIIGAIKYAFEEYWNNGYCSQLQHVYLPLFPNVKSVQGKQHFDEITHWFTHHKIPYDVRYINH